MTEVTEFDLRAPEFKHPDVKPEDFERRADGAIVRKDRWETGIRRVANALDMSVREFEISDVIDAAAQAGLARDVLNEAYQRLSSPQPCAPTTYPDDSETAFKTGKLSGQIEGRRAAFEVLIRAAANAGYIFK